MTREDGEAESRANNPYAPPAPASDDADRSVPRRGARLDAALYTYRHVVLATFLGTTLGGALVMALNEHRLGRMIAAINTLLAGVVATAFLLTIGYVAPDNIPTFPISIASLFVMAALARWRQGAAVTQHYAAGGKRGSGWAAAGFGIFGLFVVLVPLAAFFLLEDAAAGR